MVCPWQKQCNWIKANYTLPKVNRQLIIAHAINRANLIWHKWLWRTRQYSCFSSSGTLRSLWDFGLEWQRLMHDYTFGINRLQPSSTFIIMRLITLYNGAIRTKNSEMTVRVAVYALALADSTTAGPDQIIIETCRWVQAQLIIFAYWITE